MRPMKMAMKTRRPAPRNQQVNLQRSRLQRRCPGTRDHGRPLVNHRSSQHGPQQGSSQGCRHRRGSGSHRQCRRPWWTLGSLRSGSCFRSHRHGHERKHLLSLSPSRSLNLSPDLSLRLSRNLNSRQLRNNLRGQWPSLSLSFSLAPSTAEPWSRSVWSVSQSKSALRPSRMKTKTQTTM